MRRPHHAGGIGRIGGAEHDVRVGRLDGAHDRAEIGGRGRVGIVVDDLEAVRLGLEAGALRRVDSEFAVGGDDRHRLRPRLLLRREIKEAG